MPGSSAGAPLFVRAILDRLGRDGELGIVVLGAMTFFYSAWPLWRALYPLEIDLKEPWNAYHADAAFSWALYPDPAGLVANNYPPLWFYLTGAVGWLTGDVVGVGRLLSLAALMALAILAARLVLLLGGCRLGAALASIWLIATMVRYADWYVAMNDPNLTALAIMGGALLWLLGRDPQRGSDAPVLVMVLGGFFKHSLIAIPLTAFVVLARRDRAAACRAAVVGIIASACLIALFTAIYGRFFLDQLFFYSREISLGRSVRSLDRIGGLVPALAVWAIWSWDERHREPTIIGACLIGFSLFSYLLQKSGGAVDINAQFELIFAVAIGLGLVFDRVGAASPRKGAARNAIVAVLALSIVAAPGLEPYFLWFSSDYRGQFQKNVAIMLSEVERIDAIPGPVHCTILTVCRDAGKPFLLDEVSVEQKLAAGALTRTELTAIMSTIHTEAIDPNASMQTLMRQLFYGRVIRR
jgi:hypothetical protein